MRITGTFLDEISYDIPHQNWGYKEWDRDFQSMKSIGIDTVIQIRCGHNGFITYPSKVLTTKAQCFMPPTDLLEMFLELSEKYGMKFYFGTYDSGNCWKDANFELELDINKEVVSVVWTKYGKHKAFKGWYLATEISRRRGSAVEAIAGLGRYCKEISDNLPVLISPLINGIKQNRDLGLDKGSIPLAEHEAEWDSILGSLEGAVDQLAFQDGHVELKELAGYLKINCALARKHGIECWTNCETFDRDMPIKFLPIKWEKMWNKLQIAEAAGIEKAITFEFSHFMSPNSCYPQAHGLFDRYREYAGLT